MITLDSIPPVRITDGPITIAALGCGCVQFYAGHDITVNHPVLCAQPDAGHSAGHGLTVIGSTIRTTVVQVTETTT